MNTNRCLRPLILAAFLVPATALRAWDYEGHRIVNQLALKSLPAEFPAFVHTPEAAERIAFLAGEPARWRNTPDQPIANYNGVDHYLDLVAAGRVDLGPMLTHTFPLDDWRTAFAALADQANSGAVKVAIDQR